MATDILVDPAAPSSMLLTQYAQTGSAPISVDGDTLHQLGIRVIEADLLDDGPLIRHAPAKLRVAAMHLLTHGPGLAHPPKPIYDEAAHD